MSGFFDSLPAVEPRLDVDDALAAIARENDRLVAFSELFNPPIAPAGGETGPLSGLIVSLKDLFAVAGHRTRAGSEALDRLESTDAAVVDRLIRAGATLIGKTTMHEFAMGVITPGSANPHDTSRIAGGSSGGAAISVAAGMCQVAIGSDTRGSVRIPAALCGVVGFKPTFGLIPIDGAVPLSWSMDHCGVLGSSVSDVAGVFEVLALRHLPGLGERDLRIGRVEDGWHEIDQTVRGATETALTAIDLPIEATVGIGLDDLEAANRASLVVSRSEALEFHRSAGFSERRYTADVRGQLQAAEQISADELGSARRTRSELQRRMAALTREFDVLMMPTVPIVAPPSDQLEGVPLRLTRNTAIWSFLGYPAITLPLPRESGALPAALQLVGAPWRDGVVLEAAKVLETALR